MAGAVAAAPWAYKAEMDGAAALVVMYTRSSRVSGEAGSEGLRGDAQGRNGEERTPTVGSVCAVSRQQRQRTAGAR